MVTISVSQPFRAWGAPSIKIEEKHSNFEAIKLLNINLTSWGSLDECRGAMVVPVADVGNTE